MCQCAPYWEIEGTSQNDHQSVSVFVNFVYYNIGAFSALTLLVGQQEGHPACKRTEWWGAGVLICLEQGADLHMAQLMPLPLTVSCFSKIQIHLGSIRKGPLNGLLLLLLLLYIIHTTHTTV